MSDAGSAVAGPGAPSAADSTALNMNWYCYEFCDCRRSPLLRASIANELKLYYILILLILVKKKETKKNGSHCIFYLVFDRFFNCTTNTS